MKKFLIKLVNWQAQRDDNPKMIHDANQQDQARLAREKNEQVTEDKKYVSKRTIPSEEKILGPSEPKKTNS